MSKISTSNRESGIELLKIIAIFLIVISHVTQTLGQANKIISYQDYVLYLGNPTTNIQVIILTFLRQAGGMGNIIFFVCSAWFLVGKKEDTKKKAFSLLCTVWVISIIYLIIFYIINPSYIDKDIFMKEVLPTCNANNWYLTCYIIFLFIYPFLNKLFEVVNQRQHLRITLFSSFLWIILNYFRSDWFFPSNIILWTTIYFLIAYIKIYCIQVVKNKKVGLLLSTIGLIGSISQVVVTNYVALHIFDNNKGLLQWNKSCSPFYIMLAVGVIIIALQGTFKNKMINYISSLSLFVYLIHENLLVRIYMRPAIWQYLFFKYGYSKVLLLDLIYAIILFVISIFISALYKSTIQKIVDVLSNKLYIIITYFYKNIENKLIE